MIHWSSAKGSLNFSKLRGQRDERSHDIRFVSKAPRFYRQTARRYSWKAAWTALELKSAEFNNFASYPRWQPAWQIVLWRHVCDQVAGLSALWRRLDEHLGLPLVV